MTDSIGPVRDFHLENGLLVRLKEIHTAPLISSWVWYRVGSRNEIQGITGISHWVEHMQLKGRLHTRQVFLTVRFRAAWCLECTDLSGLDLLFRDHAGESD